EDCKGTIKLWQNVRPFLDKEFPDAAMISEWGEPDKSLQGGFHMDFLLHFGPSHYNDLFRCDHPFFGGDGDASEFVNKYLDNYEKSERKGLICIPSGNHDMDRLARTIQGVQQKISFAFLLSMPGAPFIYYGDEIGMRYVEGLTSVEGGYNRTGSRSPMQWDTSVNAGFSSAPASALYVPMDPDPARPNVAAQMADPNSLWHEIQRLIQIRKVHPALQSKGEIQFLYAEKNAYPLAYLRTFGEEKILVVLNPSDRAASFALNPEACEAGSSCKLLLGEMIYGVSDGDGSDNICEEKDGLLTISPRSAAFIRVS
ncbi:MAG: alpha-glucosidase C-terminal domain-containing protein, partial [Lachnospiraceae bacterium]|nr:alpha-glucosidase C-terminal domain-containing protein [Lachnospiraceae bacterium]